MIPSVQRRGPVTLLQISHVPTVDASRNSGFVTSTMTAVTHQMNRRTNVVGILNDFKLNKIKLKHGFNSASLINLTESLNKQQALSQT